MRRKQPVGPPRVQLELDASRDHSCGVSDLGTGSFEGRFLGLLAFFHTIDTQVFVSQSLEVACQRGEAMSREQKIAAVEVYLACFETKDLSKVPLAENVTFEGPLVGTLAGRQAVKGFLASILPMVKGVHVKQHIVEGNYVATVFDMETLKGVDHVFDRIQVVDGEIKDIHTFYYPKTA